MATEKALFIQGSAGAPTYSAADLRNLLAALVGGSNYEAVAPGTGAIARGHGVLTPDALAVTPNGTPNNHVFVAPGNAAIRGSSNNNQGTYIVGNNSSFDITVTAAHATLDRKDLVVARVKDNAFGIAGDIWTPELLVGTAGSGSPPTVTEDTLVLAELLVRDSTEAGGTIVRAQDITDRRVQARAVGGITPVSAFANYPSPRKGDFAFDEGLQQLGYYSGTAWLIAAFAGGSTSYLGGNPFNNLILGSGGVTYGRYFKLGRLVVVMAGFQLGTGGDVASTLEFQLPFTAASISGFTGNDASVGGFCAARAFAQNSSVRVSGTGVASATVMTNFVAAFASAAWTFNQPFDWSDAGAGSKFQAIGIFESTT